MKVSELDTPALVVDLDVLERNIAGMAKLCDDIGIDQRVHTKTHKTPEIAKLQVAAGSRGITCQKLGEAEAMVDGGLDDILIPYNIVGKPKLERLVRLARKARITVSADSAHTVNGIAEAASSAGITIPVLVEMDTGAGRCGVQTPAGVTLLAESIDSLAGVEFAGVMTYPSRRSARAFLDEAVESLATVGMQARVISGGGTGFESASQWLGCTETRSGSYIYEGMTRVGRSEDLTPDRCALRLIVTVVSVPTVDRVIIDAGQKSFASYPPSPYGHVIERPDAKIRSMSVEHGHIDASECDQPMHVGDRLSVIPLHQGMTSNLHDELVAVRSGVVEDVWRIAGRGRAK
jgi:D-serine deaminase-like pyridoxal phosphate-dependent protein